VHMKKGERAEKWKGGIRKRKEGDNNATNDSLKVGSHVSGMKILKNEKNKHWHP